MWVTVLVVRERKSMELPQRDRLDAHRWQLDLELGLSEILLWGAQGKHFLGRGVPAPGGLALLGQC